MSATVIDFRQLDCPKPIILAAFRVQTAQWEEGMGLLNTDGVAGTVAKRLNRTKSQERLVRAARQISQYRARVRVWIIDIGASPR